MRVAALALPMLAVALSGCVAREVRPTSIVVETPLVRITDSQGQFVLESGKVQPPVIAPSDCGPSAPEGDDWREVLRQGKGRRVVIERDGARPRFGVLQLCHVAKESESGRSGRLRIEVPGLAFARTQSSDKTVVVHDTDGPPAAWVLWIARVPLGAPPGGRGRVESIGERGVAGPACIGETEAMGWDRRAPSTVWAVIAGSPQPRSLIVSSPRLGTTEQPWDEDDEDEAVVCARASAALSQRIVLEARVPPCEPGPLCGVQAGPADGSKAPPWQDDPRQRRLLVPERSGISARISAGLGLRLMYGVPMPGALVGVALGGAGRHFSVMGLVDGFIGQDVRGPIVGSFRVGVFFEVPRGSWVRAGFGLQLGVVGVGRRFDEPTLGGVLHPFVQVAFDAKKWAWARRSVYVGARVGVDLAMANWSAIAPGQVPVFFVPEVFAGMRFE